MATKKPKGLGRGLEALLGGNDDAAQDSAAQGAPSMLKLSQLQPGKYQPRTRMDEGSLYELAESIKSQGIMQPILVRPLAEPISVSGQRDAGPQGPSAATGAASATVPRYEIIAGERRFRAAKLAGLDEVPVLVKPVSDDNAAIMALIENIQREDLNPLEEAHGIERLVTEFKLTHEQAAQAVGRSRSAVSNLLRLLQLAEPVQHLLMSGDLEMGHARALLPLPRAEQITAAHQIVARQLSVREAEKLAQQPHAGGGARQKAMRLKADKPRDVLRLEEELADTLAAPVEVRLKGKGKRGKDGRLRQAGEVVIGFGSLDELDGLLARLRGG
jgi:ParB family chromosome partitioning protein